MSKKLFLCFVLFNGIALVAGEDTRITKRKAAAAGIEGGYEIAITFKSYRSGGMGYKITSDDRNKLFLHALRNNSKFEDAFRSLGGIIDNAHARYKNEQAMYVLANPCYACESQKPATEQAQAEHQRREMRLKRLRRQLD